jgi:hypothetical protein
MKKVIAAAAIAFACITFSAGAALALSQIPLETIPGLESEIINQAFSNPNPVSPAPLPAVTPTIPPPRYICNYSKYATKPTCLFKYRRQRLDRTAQS